MTAERVQRELAEVLREQIASEVSEWESFVAGDGYRSIRKRDARTPDQIADALLSGPLAPLLAKVQRVEAALTRHAVRLGEADVINVLHIRRALDGTT